VKTKGIENNILKLFFGKDENKTDSLEELMNISHEF